MGSKDELDEILDRALSEYGGTEPLAGLEQRILQRTLHAARSRKWLYLGWSLASALLVLLGIFYFKPDRVQPVQAPDRKEVIAQATVSPKPIPVAMHPVTKSYVRTRAKVRVQRRQPMPKLDQFPTVSPLTTEERALVAFAREHPQEAIAAFESLSKPLEVQPLEKQTAP